MNKIKNTLIQTIWETAPRFETASLKEPAISNGTNVYRFNKRSHVRAIGCIVAGNVDGKVRVSWSICNTKADKPNRKFALKQAFKRVAEGVVAEPPKAVLKEVVEFSYRAMRFYKTDAIEIVS